MYARPDTRAYICTAHNVCGNVLVFPSSSLLRLLFSFSVFSVSPLLTRVHPFNLISPRLCSPEYMSLVHDSRQPAAVNVVSLPVHRGLHTLATPSSYQRPTPASRHSVASSTRQKRSFFGVGEILHVIVNVRMSFRLAPIARLMPG